MVLYPGTPGSKFDFDYYAGSHLALVREKLGTALKDVEFVKGLSDTTGGPAPFVAMANLLFESLDAFQQAMGSVGDELMGDVPVYTDIQPVMQISEVIS